MVTRVPRLATLLALGLAARCVGTQPAVPPPTGPIPEQLKADRRAFQELELTTARPFSWVFNPGTAPRIIWRDAERARELGWTGRLTVRWFDANLSEQAVPNHPGRWTAYVESTAPNGTPVRRSLTFYARPPGFLIYPPPEVPPAPYQPGPIPEAAWMAHRAELTAAMRDFLLRGLNDSPAAAILLSALADPTAPAAATRPSAVPDTDTETAQARHEAHHLAVKLKVLNLSDKVRPLPQPATRPTPAPVLREGTPADAGVAPGTKEAIDALCRQWAADSGEPFVTLVARRGVIVTHEAFGVEAQTRQPVPLDYRADVASITKTITALLFARFVDRGIVRLDDPVSVALPDYPKGSPHVPTFRQCLTHTSGLSGHGDFDGVRNPHFENVVLNGLDANEPGNAYVYSGAGFDLTAKAMETLTGTPWRQLYQDHLFAPLGIKNVPMGDASAGAQCTARDLAALAQLLLNRGSYGPHQLFSEETYRQLLPEPLSRRYPGITEVEGIGMHFMATAPGTLSAETLGHGSLSGTTFLVDPERDLVVIQLRRQHGPRHGDYFPRFLQTIVANLR